ncbi:MAG: hypothetical protein N2Z74_06330, partial [Syntrophales bacterium]|nr:hypothetical protein [Syntrophales bacterium]
YKRQTLVLQVFDESARYDLNQVPHETLRHLLRVLGLDEAQADTLAARVIGEATPERVATVRKATAIVEEILKDTGAFQYLAILHEDRVTGMRDGRREFGQQIEVRCWDSVDARQATPTRLSFDMLERLAAAIISGVPGVVSVTYNIAPKPPSTIEAV